MPAELWRFAETCETASAQLRRKWLVQRLHAAAKKLGEGTEQTIVTVVPIAGIPCNYCELQRHARPACAASTVSSALSTGLRVPVHEFACGCHERALKWDWSMRSLAGERPVSPTAQSSGLRLLLAESSTLATPATLLASTEAVDDAQWGSLGAGLAVPRNLTTMGDIGDS